MPTVGDIDDEENTEEYTRILFSCLTRQQLIQHGIPEQDIVQNANLEFLNIPQTNGMLMKQIASDLRKISDEFERSPQRQQVRGHANEFQSAIANLDYNQFRTFLDELFIDGITRTRIVTLFFFCTDIVVQAYDQSLSTLKCLFKWFLSYICDKVCKWVEEHGGWHQVLSVYVPALSKTAFYICATVALAVFIIKNV